MRDLKEGDKWYRRGKEVEPEGGGRFPNPDGGDERFYTSAECFQMAIQFDVESDVYWNALGAAGGGIITVMQKTREVGAKDCHIEALRLNPKNDQVYPVVAERAKCTFSSWISPPQAWSNLGVHGGTTGTGNALGDFSQKTCFKKCAPLHPSPCIGRPMVLILAKSRLVPSS